MAILAKLLDMDFKFVLPRINSNSRTDFDYFTWGGGGGGGGGVWTNHGGCNCFPDNGLARRHFAPPHSREFFPEIGLLARRNFAHTIQDLL